MAVDMIALCQRATDRASELIASLRDDELSKPTPCAEWDVRGLVGHMIGVCQGFASAVTGTPRPESPAPPDASARDLAAAYASAKTAAMDGWRSPGALERTLHLAFGEVPGAMAIGLNFADQLIHSWDLGRAVGRDPGIDPDLAETALQMGRQRVGPEMRGPGRPFSAEVPAPAGAPVQDQMAAFFGRQL